MKRAERLIDRTDKASTRTKQDDRCEVVEGMDFVMAVLDLPGREPADLHISIVDEEMRIEGPGLHITTELPCRVDPTGLGSDYRNGILSVKILKPSRSAGTVAGHFIYQEKEECT